MNGRLRERLGVSPLAVVGLAALGIPRVVAHDLELVGPVVNGLLVFVPLAVWLAFVLWKRVPAPFLTLLAVGLAYGVVLGIVHQLLWSAALGADPPVLGGNLAGVLPPVVEAIVLRMFAFGSSVFTGVVVGAATGIIAWLLAKIVPGFRARC